MRARILLPLLCGVPLSPAAGQEHDHAHTEGLGRVVFAVSCNEAAQRHFERAMAVLHSFWWEEGPNAFGAVLQADSTCAMGHWGLALNAWGNPFAGGPAGDQLKQGAAHAEHAAALGAPTPRERGFIAAASALYRNSSEVRSAVRLRAFSDTLARVYRENPNDPEVALYYALSLVATASPTDTTLSRQKQAAGILNPLYARYPQHPGLAHYIIHANDSPRLASLGLDAARRYAGIAPSAPHAQHMPSHIFIRLGLWDETIESNQRSYDAGLAFARARGVEGVAYHEFHALDYMVYGYLQQGKDSAAARTVREALGITQVTAPSAVLRRYNITAMEARIPIERGDWRAAMRLQVRAPDVPISEMLSRFARGVGAARAAEPVQLREEVDALARIEQTLATNRDNYWSQIAGIKRQALNAWLLLSSGDTVGALREAKLAADREDVTEKHPITPGELLPARELEADLHFQLGHYAAARTAYLETLKREPGRARSIYGAARSAELAGQRDLARSGYRDYLKLVERGDGTRQEVATARTGVGAR
jgi:hypothetical protein